MKDSSESRSNCFDVLRLALAFIVIYSHSYYLGGFGDDALVGFSKERVVAGRLAVLGFFGLSGFLVAGSYVRCKSAMEYLRHRFLRIMPGFWVCLVVTAFGIGPAIASVHGSFLSYPWNGPESAFSYICNNLSLHVTQWNIGSILKGLPYTASLNGSLWSLLPEFSCYLVLMGIGLTQGLGGRRLFLIVFTTVLASFHAVATFAPQVITVAVPKSGTVTGWAHYCLAFFAGAVFWAYRSRWLLGKREAVLSGVALVLVLKYGGYWFAGPVIVPMLMLSVGNSFVCRVPHDISYGVYIYAFPVQQLLACLPVFRQSVWLFMAGSILLTVCFATASWFFVERVFVLRRRDSLRLQHAVS